MGTVSAQKAETETMGLLGGMEKKHGFPTSGH